jgi:transposase InsO family protein
MLLTQVLHPVMKIVQPVIQKLEARVKAWTKPATESLIGSVIADLVKSRPDLIAENAFLRHQLIVLKRQGKQPKLTSGDRGLLVLLASRTRDWKNALLIVKPDTLVKWHRQGFKLFWRQKSRDTARQPRIAEETIALIQQMAVENRLWGTKRIRGELLKLGVCVNKGTVRRYMTLVRRKLPPRHHDQTWATFLSNHASEIWASDFVQTYDLFFRTIFLFFIIEHCSRRVVHFGVTYTPTDAWIAQQMREATPFGESPRFLICDNDGKYGAHFNRVAEGSGIKIIRTPLYAPKANAICERFIGSVRRECLDLVLILNESHARRILREYVMFFNHDRPHQGIDQQIPEPQDFPSLPQAGPTDVVSRPILGGLHHDYHWAA